MLTDSPTGIVNVQPILEAIWLFLLGSCRRLANAAPSPSISSDNIRHLRDHLITWARGNDFFLLFPAFDTGCFSRSCIVHWCAICITSLTQSISSALFIVHCVGCHPTIFTENPIFITFLSHRICIYQKKVVPLHSISKVFFFPFGATACGRTFQCPTTDRSAPQPPRPKIEVL